MLEPLPPGACAVLVTEDFLEMHIGVPELWVHNLYVFVEVVANPIGTFINGLTHCCSCTERRRLVTTSAVCLHLLLFGVHKEQHSKRSNAWREQRKGVVKN